MGKVNNRASNWVRGTCIGRGSFGTVSLAAGKSDGQVFAVKSVDMGLCLDAQVAALENEIGILRSLSSPCVVAYLGDDVTVEDGAGSYRNLHLEYLPGGTAADLAKRSGNDVDESAVRSVTWCVVSALRHVHSLGIVHCDVKGRNVLLGPGQSAAKLADFGSAARFPAVSPPRGSPLWMAPEVVRGEYQGPESDVWSLGCTVIEMVTGRPAWEDRGADTLCKIGYSDELPEIPNQLSELGRDFVGKCLRKDRTERWSSDQLLRHPFISSSEPVNWITHQSPRCVLDLFNDDNYEEEDRSSLGSETRTRSCRDRIGRLASSPGAIWESDDWVVVRNIVTSDRAAEVTDACTSGDEEEETSSEYSNFMRIEEEIERAISEYFNSGDGVTVEVADGGGGWRGMEAGSSCRYGLRRWDWVAESESKLFTAGLVFILRNLLCFTALICNSFGCIILLILQLLLEISISQTIPQFFHLACKVSYSLFHP